MEGGGFVVVDAAAPCSTIVFSREGYRPTQPLLLPMYVRKSAETCQRSANIKATTLKWS